MPTIARRRDGLAVIAAFWLAGQAASAYALYDPAKEYVEAPAVAARYPDPPLDIPTPAFKPGRTDFTSQEELVAFVDGLAARSADLRVRIVGRSPIRVCVRGVGIWPDAPAGAVVATAGAVVGAAAAGVGGPPAGGGGGAQLVSSAATDPRERLNVNWRRVRRVLVSTAASSATSAFRADRLS